MLRNLVVFQLVVTLLAGPWLCCCSASALAADRPAPPARGVAHERVSQSCCSHRQAAEHGSKPTQPDRDTAPCPCKGAPAVEKVAPELGDLSWLRLAADAAFASVLFAEPAAVAGSADRGLIQSGALFPSADALLFAHHNLRC